MKKFILSLLIWEIIGLFIFSFIMPFNFHNKEPHNINVTYSNGLTQNLYINIPPEVDCVIKKYNNDTKLIIKSYGYTVWGYKSNIVNIEAEIPSVNHVNFIKKLN